jgi:hypothetical protein
MAEHRIMRGLANTKVMAPPAPDPRVGIESVPAVRMLMAYDLERDEMKFRLDCMAVNSKGELKQHTYDSPPGVTLGAVAIGEGLIALGQLLKEWG